MRNSTKSALLSIVLGVVALAAPAAEAGRMAVAWEPVAGASGYRIYYGEASGEYSGSVDAGDVTEGVLDGLPNCRTWYVAVKAYNAAGESDEFSNELVGWPRPEIVPDSTIRMLQGEQLLLDLHGSNFKPGAELVFDARDADGNSLVRVDSVDVVSCHHVQALVTVEPDARGFRAMEVGSHRLWVRNPNAVAGFRWFDVRFDERRIDINRTSVDTTDRVDAMDLVWLAHAHGAIDGEARFNADADLNGDGFVDGEDLAHLASRFGDCWDGAGWSREACPQ